MARKKLTLIDYRRALRKVRTKLLNGRITKKQFNMDFSYMNTECGTVACIGGWMAVELLPPRRRNFSAVNDVMEDARLQQVNLDALFHRYTHGKRSISRRRAAAAITRALDGAENPWKSR